MRNAKEEIEYQKRKFVFHLCGDDDSAPPLGGGDCVFNFLIPSPNETANSNNYNQCLIKIKSAYLNNCRDNDGGLNSVFTEISTAAAANAVRLCAAGCYLKSDIATNNCLIQGTNPGVLRGGVGCILHAPDQQYKGVNAVGGIAAPGGSSTINLGAAAGGAGLQGANSVSLKTNTWMYQDHRAIEDSGYLCGSPFNKQISFTLLDASFLERVRLQAASNLGGVGSTGASISIELEVLMLPNPTPMDR